MIEFFSVYDAVAERYIDPFPCPNAGVALRSFEEACRKEGHAFTKHPEDYSLWHIGQFDPELGVLEGMKPRKLAMASSFVRTEPFEQLQILEEGSAEA